jgi:nitrate reductase NapAB chaperone NapD
MPIKSYLVFPHEGKQKALKEALIKLSWCEVIPAENRNLLVLVTDTKDKEDEENCLLTINGLNSLEHMTLVSGFSDNNNAL